MAYPRRHFIPVTMPVSSFLHIPSSCSRDPYRSCHLSAVCALQSPGIAALHRILPGRYSALHELHSLLPQYASEDGLVLHTNDQARTLPKEWVCI